MTILTALDGTLIVLGHVTTVNYGLDHEAYRSESFRHFKAKNDIERAKDNPELQSNLKKALAEMFPDGEPRINTFYRTKVGLTDGKSYWVNASRDHVVGLLTS